MLSLCISALIQTNQRIAAILSEKEAAIKTSSKVQDICHSGVTSAVVDEEVEHNSSLSSSTESANGKSSYHLEAPSTVVSMEQHGDYQDTNDDIDEDDGHRSTAENDKEIQPQESSICGIKPCSSSGEVALTDNDHNSHDVEHHLSVTSGDNSYYSEPGNKHSLIGIQLEGSDLNNHRSLTTEGSDSDCECKSSEHILDLRVVRTSSPIVTSNSMETGTYSYPTTFENRETAMNRDSELEICDRESESGREQQLET